jgi:RNA recognition motif-containing protein
VRFGPLKGAIVNNILVGNLGLNVTEQDIRFLFDKHGIVRRFKMMTDRRTGLSRGFGFIQMKTDTEAAEAIVALNGTDLNGKTLQVNQARPQLHRRERAKAGTESVTETRELKKPNECL